MNAITQFIAGGSAGSLFHGAMMNIRTLARRWAAARCLARVIVAVAIPAFALGPNAGAGAAQSPPDALHRPVIVSSSLHPNLPAGQLYTIDDTYGPSSTTYPQGSYPVAFNNSGQILGYAYVVKNGTTTADCVLYTGTGYRDLTSSTSVYDCTPFGISGADSTETFRFVGAIRTPYWYDSVAFYGTWVVGATKGTFTQFSSNNPSALYGVNLLGEAVGYGEYNPPKPLVNTQPIFVLDPPATSLAVAEKSNCATTTYCGYLENAETNNGGCPFGGCFINDAGTILSYNTYKQRQMIFTYGVNGVTDLPIASQFAVAINNAGQVLYWQYNYNTSGGTTTETAAIYSTTTKTTTTIPTLAGSSCTYFLPLSLSNTGQVLGYTASCSVESDNVYWTWDPVNGLQNLNKELPKNYYSSIQPIGVNDNGQILVALQPTNSTLHWGFLIPPASTAAKTRDTRVMRVH